MNRNYIIFFWIICLILFTFYCVFRLKYLSDNTHKNINTPNNLQEKYVDLPPPSITEYTGDVLVTRAALTTVPMITETNNFITYIENIQAKDKVIDMKTCENLYDDNLKVRDLGYKNCGEAYADYLDKNYDLYTTYGNPYTLAEICPIASKTAEYNKCLQLLLTKFTDGVNLLDSVNTDMGNSINKRLNVRTDALYKIQASINPFIYSKLQNDFNNDMLMKKQVGNTRDDKLNLINKFYQDKYRGSVEAFSNNTNTLETFTNVTSPDIDKLFFGKYKPVSGQFSTLADLIFTIEYDDSGSNLNLNLNANTNTNTTQASPQASTQASPTQASPQPTTQSKLSPLAVKTNARRVNFTLSNNDIYIVYTVSNIDFYKLNKNTIKLILTEKNIIYQSSPSNTIEPLLTQLGLFAPTSINLVYEPYTSTEKKKHDTYKLVNDNLDTILVLEKIPKPKPKPTKSMQILPSNL